MESTFRYFFDNYIENWRRSSLVEFKKVISKDYKAREVSDGSIVDFGYEESIVGWEQGFKFVKENNAEWDLKEVTIIPLNATENMAIISATLISNGKKSESTNLFMQTFKLVENNDWMLVRSYIEARSPLSKMSSPQFN